MPRSYVRVKLPCIAYLEDTNLPGQATIEAQAVLLLCYMDA